MSLGNDFRFAHLVTKEKVEKVGKIRRVRTLEGSRIFQKPVGAIITRRDYLRAKEEGRLEGNKKPVVGGRRGRGGGGGAAGGRSAAPQGRRGANAPAAGGNKAGKRKAPQKAPAASAPLSPKGEKLARQIGNKLAPKNLDDMKVRIDADKSISPNEKKELHARIAARKAELRGDKPPARAEAPAKAPARREAKPPAPEKAPDPTKQGRQRRVAPSKDEIAVDPDLDAKGRAQARAAVDAKNRANDKAMGKKPAEAAKERAQNAAAAATRDARLASDEAKPKVTESKALPKAIQSIVNDNPSADDILARKAIDKDGVAARRAEKPMVNPRPPKNEYMGKFHDVPDDVELTPEIKAMGQRITGARNLMDLEEVQWDIDEIPDLSEAHENFLKGKLYDAEKRLGIDHDKADESQVHPVAKEIAALIAEETDLFTILMYRNNATGMIDNDSQTFGSPKVTDVDLMYIDSMAYDRERELRESGALFDDLNPTFKVDFKAVPPPPDVQALDPEVYESLWGEKKPSVFVPKAKGYAAGDYEAYNQLMDGKKISEVTDSENLWHSVLELSDDEGSADPAPALKRFRVQKVGAGQGGAYNVLDRETGEMTFFKTGNNGYSEASADREKADKVMFNGDSAAEIVASNFGKQAFPEYFLGADYASPPTDQRPVIRIDHASVLGDDVKFEAVERITFNGARMIANPEASDVDPKSALAVHIFDYLTNQTDRHVENYGTAKGADGKTKIIAFDHGAAFNSFSKYPLTVAGFDIPDHVITEPESVAYDEWAKYYVARNDFVAKGAAIGTEVSRAYDFGERQQELIDDANEIIEVYKGVDLDAMMADLFERFPDMDSYEAGHIYTNFGILKSRLRNIDGQQIARAVGYMTGMED